MVEDLAAPDPDVISKSEFARRRNVKPPRVTQWIEAGKIFGPAIVGEGRGAQIRESVACQQLNRTLDASQRLGNGLATRLNVAPAPAQPAMQFEQPPTGGRAADPQHQPLTVQDRIAIEKLDQVRRQNERERREEAVASGLLVDARSVRTASVRQVASMLTGFDGTLNNFATVLAAEFGLQQRDVLHALRSQFRKQRSQWAADLRTRAAALPEHVDLDLDAESPPTAPDDAEDQAGAS